MNILEEIKRSYRKGNILFRLIYINIGIFVALNVLFVFVRLFTPDMTLTELRIMFNDKVLQFLIGSL